MGRRGKAPTPTTVKIARGETRPSRIGGLEPEPRLAGPTMPEDMDAGAQIVWKRVLVEMGGTGVIRGADTDVLRCYCEAVSRYATVQKLYLESGPMLRDRGHLVKSPLHQVLRDNVDLIRLFARELGLSPSVARA